MFSVPFDDNAVMGLMAVSVRDVSASGSVLCLKEKKKYGIHFLSLSVCTGLKTLTLTELPCRV